MVDIVMMISVLTKPTDNDANVITYQVGHLPCIDPARITGIPYGQFLFQSTEPGVIFEEVTFKCKNK